MLSVGAVLLAGTMLLAPPPEQIGVLTGLDEDESLARDDLRVAVRQPQIGDEVATRYDAEEEEVTYAVFGCGHGYCETAIPLRGDVRDRLEARDFLLVQETPGPIVTEPLEPPINTSEHERSVNRTVSSTFEIGSPWPGMLGVDAGIWLLAAAVPVLVPGISRRSALPGAAGIAAAVAIGHLSAGGFFLDIVVIPVVLGAGAAYLGGRAIGRRWTPLLWTALAAAALLAVRWTLAAYSPPVPAI